MTFTVREARDDELARAGEVVAAAYLADFGGGHPGYLEEIRATRRRAATCPILVVVDDRGVLLGSVTYVPDADNPYAETEAPDEAGFRMLGVDPAARGLGVGAALVRACLDRARDAGMGGVAITSTPFMTTAHAVRAPRVPPRRHARLRPGAGRAPDDLRRPLRRLTPA